MLVEDASVEDELIQYSNWNLPLSTLIDVVLTKSPSEGGRTFAGVGVQTIDTGAPVLAEVAGAVVDVDLAVLSSVAWNEDHSLEDVTKFKAEENFVQMLWKTLE